MDASAQHRDDGTERLSRYELVERIAVGGMAEVFRAKTYGAHGFEKTLAIKRILPSLASNPEFEQRFIAEAKIAVTLSHANIVQVLDFSRFGDSLYIVMEFVEGVDLATLLDACRDSDQPLPVGAALHIAMEMCKGLEFAHRCDVVHRDVSPSNVLISRNGEVKIADFGIAQAADIDRDGTFRIVGKWPYMSPEQTRGEPLDHRSDLFSLGSVLFELFTSTRLFRAEEVEDVVRMIRAGGTTRLTSIRSDLPGRIDDIVQGLLRARRELRTPNASVALGQLVDLSYQSSLPATAMSVASVLGERLPTSEPGELADGTASAQLIDDIINSELKRRGEPMPQRHTRVTVSDSGTETDDVGTLTGDPPALSEEGREARDGAAAEGDRERRVLTFVAGDGDLPVGRAESLPVGLKPPTAYVVGETPRGVRQRVRALLRSRNGRMAAVGAATLIVIGVGWFVGTSWRASSPPATAAASTLAPARPTIALLPFEVLADHPELDFAASGLPQLLGRQLERSDELDVIGYYELLDNVSSESAPSGEWEAAARELGATVLVRGHLEGEGDSVSAVLEVEQSSGALLATIEREGSIQELPKSVATASRDIATAVLGDGGALGSGEGPGFAAERNFQLGIAALSRDQFGEATVLLRRAVEADPGFAEARYHLALSTWWSSVDIPEVQYQIREALKADLSADKRAFLLSLQKLADNDYPAAIDSFGRAAENFPKNAEIAYGLFESLFHGGYPADAMEIYKRVRELAPGFRLGIMHPLAYYVSRADDEGMGWALSNLHTDQRNRFWNVKARVARRDYAGAEKLIESIKNGIAGPLTASERKNLDLEMVAILAVTGREELALAQVEAGNIDKRDLAGWGIGLATGDEAVARQYGDMARERLARARPGYWTAAAILDVAPMEIVGGRDDDRRAMLDAIDGVDPTFAPMMGLAQVELLLADELDESHRIARHEASVYPVVSMTARALASERAGDVGAAARLWERAIDFEGDGRFRSLQFFRLAKNRAELGDHAGVVRACDEVIRPRLHIWSWGSIVGPCRLMTAQAAVAIGDRDLARASFAALAALRNRAGERDELAARARQGLDELR